ncbi:hypothetical protein, partial [Parabacteroides johnsonii]|uniref:hypothetical protein n=1 Tax=Parabacteroides johnsonii TaxID=387661 RepID=UPI001C3866AC
KREKELVVRLAPFSVSAFSIKLLPEKTSREERISSCGRCIGLVGGEVFFRRIVSWGIFWRYNWGFFRKNVE